MSVVDVAMVGRLGTEALAATGMGSMMFWGALSLAIEYALQFKLLPQGGLGRVYIKSLEWHLETDWLWLLYILSQLHSLFGDTLIHSLDFLLKTHPQHH